MNAILIILHLLSAVVWVGGMAFAHFFMRPALLEIDAPVRLRLFRGVLQRFLPVVLGAVVILLLSGFGLFFHAFGGFAGAPLYLHLMLAFGLLMSLLFLHLYFAAWPRFHRAVDAGQLPEAAAALAGVRRIISINLALGIVTTAVGTGRYWSA